MGEICLNDETSLVSEQKGLNDNNLDKKKICFISCVSNKNTYEKCLSYLDKLVIPEGMKVERICIEDAKALTEGYNRAMKQSNAKYKVYIHQDTFILYEGFLQEVVTLLNKYPKLGLLGVAGGKNLPLSGIWWETTEKYGNVYDTSGGVKVLLDMGIIKGDYERVHVIDGLIMITQYDINWRDDLIKGWHLYDASQSMEFIKSGYEVGVPKQSQTWCFHDCGLIKLNEEYEKNRIIFINEYRDLLYKV